MQRGDWHGLQVVARFCFDGCNVVFPRWVGTVEGLRFCNSGNVPMRNSWWSVIGPKAYYDGLGWGVGNYGNGGYGRSVAGNGWLGAIDSDMVPTYSQVSGITGKQIAYAITRPEDIGKTCVIYGTQYGGQPLCELRDGVWSQGITITAKSAGGSVMPAMTTALVTKITSVVREATKGQTYLYESGLDSDGVSGLRDLAQYSPSETNPRYRSMRVSGVCAEPSHADSYGRKLRTIDAMVKLEFIPAIDDDDFILISNFQALKLGVQALILEEAGNSEDAELKWVSAIRELNYESRSKNPAYQTSVRVNTSGACILTNPI